MRSKIGLFLGIVALAVLAAVATPGAASASDARADRAGFVGQARAAGLSAAQAGGLQAKVDDYLAELAGRGTQVSPNQIDLKGAVLNVAVPGEARPRQLVAATSAAMMVRQCDFYADYEWFCAYQYERKSGDHIGMWACGTYRIPWYTTGSWENDQTPGTRPLLTFGDGTTWQMPPAFSEQVTGVYWGTVWSIRNC